MLSYLFLGANDMSASARFYEAILFPFGYIKEPFKDKLIFSLPGVPDRQNGPGAIYISPPFDGKPATPGNGMMPALRAKTRRQVNEVYQAGLQAGGTDGGQPGIRTEYSENFYVAYLHDPVGTKIALFCNDE
ncbi:VOC family protein [Mixta sp. Marseille-Q2659]|uniref:VOC family protein n=1 Tax=Mixta sp. Marseille-Q2659 TaxID=2736607 RepID=UPI0023B94D1E|nr:VOC family protein [Mixta sp. Marseille-Q2659]